MKRLTALSLFCFVGLLNGQISGSGTTNYVSKFTGPTSIGNSLIFDNGTNIGIGTISPSLKLDINGPLSLYPSSNKGTNSALNFRIVAGTNATIFQANSDYYWANHDLIFNAANSSSGNTNQLVLYRNGNVGIGMLNPGNYRLNVAGGIRADSVIVNTTGADFVFEEGYNLMSLGDLGEYVKENKHLPEIPSAREMQQEGMSVGELQTKLLQKIEELTLYVIQLNKENNELRMRFADGLR